jgi:hypothetical protein
LPSPVSLFDNKFLTNSIPNIFAPQSSVPTLNPNDLTNFGPSLGMPPPFFDPEFLRLAAASASTNPLFRFPDFNPASNPYFSSLTNMFRASQQNQNIPLTNSNPFLDAVTSPFSSSQSNQYTSSSNASNNASSQKSSPLNHSSSSFQNEKKPDSSKHQQSNGFNESTKVTSANGHFDKNQTPKTNKLSNSNTSMSKKNDTPNLLNGHMPSILNHNLNVNLTSNSTSSALTSSSPLSKLKHSSKGLKLDPDEIETIKLAIKSYKESAIFLSNSAEELEQLIGEHC